MAGEYQTIDVSSGQNLLVVSTAGRGLVPARFGTPPWPGLICRSAVWLYRAGRVDWLYRPAGLLRDHPLGRFRALPDTKALGYRTIFLSEKEVRANGER
jgi:hypothetical protein